MSTAVMTFLRDMGNHPCTTAFWAFVGVGSSFLAPVFWLGRDFSVDFVWGFVGAVVAVILYSLGYATRHRRLMRRRDRGWLENVGVHGAVTLLTVLVSIARHEHLTVSEVLSQIFVAVGVFALMEVTRPSSDFGVSQFFLRLPLQCASVLVFVKRHRTWGLLGGTFVLYVACSCWGFYYLSVFEQGLVIEGERERERERERMERERLLAGSGSSSGSGTGTPGEFVVDFSRDLDEEIIELGESGPYTGAPSADDTTGLLSESAAGQRL